MTAILEEAVPQGVARPQESIPCATKPRTKRAAWFAMRQSDKRAPARASSPSARFMVIHERRCLHGGTEWAEGQLVARPMSPRSTPSRLACIPRQRLRIAEH